MHNLLKVILLASGLSVGVATLAQAVTVENGTTETTAQYAKASIITAKVKSALLTKKNIDSTTINVQSETLANDTVIIILTGTQKSQALIDSAVSTARQVKGVTKVISKLTVANE